MARTAKTKRTTRTGSTTTSTKAEANARVNRMTRSKAAPEQPIKRKKQATPISVHGKNLISPKADPNQELNAHGVSLETIKPLAQVVVKVQNGENTNFLVSDIDSAPYFTALNADGKKVQVHYDDVLFVIENHEIASAMRQGYDQANNLTVPQILRLLERNDFLLRVIREERHPVRSQIVQSNGVTIIADVNYRDTVALWYHEDMQFGIAYFGGHHGGIYGFRADPSSSNEELPESFLGLIDVSDEKIIGE